MSVTDGTAVEVAGHARMAEIEADMAQAKVDIKALAESLQELIGGIRQLKAVQDETLRVLGQLLQRKG